MEPAIAANNLTKSFSTLRAVDHLSFTVNQGEIFGFLGPNGAGKTTSIKMMMGLLHPDEGHAIVLGSDVTNNNISVKRNIGYLAERPYLYDKLTGHEFLRYCGGLFGLSDPEIALRSSELLEMLNMKDKANDLIEGYSHGTRQKIALCAALLHRPRVAFLDEPTNGLDPITAYQVKELLRKYAEEGVTIFLSTHLLDTAEKLCDRFAIIQKGHLIVIGTLDEIRTHTRHTHSSLEEMFLSVTTSVSESEV